MCKVHRKFYDKGLLAPTDEELKIIEYLRNIVGRRDVLGVDGVPGAVAIVNAVMPPLEDHLESLLKVLQGGPSRIMKRVSSQPSVCRCGHSE